MCCKAYGTGISDTRNDNPLARRQFLKVRSCILIAIQVSASTDKSTYQKGDTVSVSITVNNES